MLFNEDKIRKRWYGKGVVSWWSKLVARLFGTMVALRKKLYDLGLLKKHRLKVPVIIIGNITAGGGGKTPFVIWLVNHLKSLGYQPGVVSRGYGGKRKVEPMLVTPNANPLASGDEPLLIAKSTQRPVVVGKNRVKAAKTLVNNHHVNIVISDDGLQHYALDRQLEVVMLDAQWQTGNGLMIPAGPLREPLERLETVDMVIYKGLMASKNYYEIEVLNIYQLNHPSITKPLADFRNQKVLVMAGIANPESFFTLLSAAGLAVVKRPLPDHHEFTEQDFEAENDMMVLITEKDAVKCEHIQNTNTWVVAVGIQVNDATVKKVNQLIENISKS